MTPQPTESAAWESRSVRSTAAMAGWTAAWVATVALAAFGPEILWNDQPALTLAAIGLSVLVGIGMLFANKRNLLAMDELQRGIQLQAMAWTLGAGLVGGVAYSLLAELAGFEAEIGHLIAFMSLVYLTGSIAGQLRYR